MDIITSILKTPDNYIMVYKETYDLFFEVFTVVANDADIIHDIVNSSHEKIGNFPFEYFGPHIADRSLTGLLCAMYYHDTLLSYQVTDYMEMNFKYNIQCASSPQVVRQFIKSVYTLKHILLTIYLQLCHNVLTLIQYYIIIKDKEIKDVKERLEERRNYENQ